MKYFAILVSLFVLDAGASEVEVKDGVIFVLGFELVPNEPLPDFSSCEECSSAHSVTVINSPNGSKSLVISDVHLDAFDAWVLIDSELLRVAGTRPGRHLLEAKWPDENIVELKFGGMGYTVTRLFNLTKSVGKDFSNLLLYSPESDLGIRLVHETDPSSAVILAETVFAEPVQSQSFPVDLDYEFLSDALTNIGSVSLVDDQLEVTYQKKGGKTVTEHLGPISWLRHQSAN